MAGDQPVHRRREAEPGDVGRQVVDAAVGDHDGAGDAVLRHVGERRGERREQPRAVGLAVGLAGLDEAHFEIGDAAEPLGELGAGRFGLGGAVGELLARALVDHDDRDRGQRIAVLAGDRRIGERQHEQRERDGAHQRAAAAREHQQQRDQRTRPPPPPRGRRQEPAARTRYRSSTQLPHYRGHMVRDASLRDAPHHEDQHVPLILRSARRARLEG